MVITGEPANAAKAMLLISQAVLEANQAASEEKQVATDARILVHTRQAGAIIGKAGVTIKQIMADSGATIRMSNDCLAGSTDKACEIKGTPEQIEQATALILTKLQEFPLKEGTETVHYLSAAQPPQAAANPYAAQAAAFANPYAQAAPSPYGAFAGMAGMPGMAGNPYGAPAVAPARSALASGTPGQFAQVELSIPANLGGAVIGKGGQAAKSIKQATACNVSVGDTDAETQMRMVTLKGTSDKIPGALRMVRGLLEPFEDGTPQTHQLAIPSNLAGTVIGKGGKAIVEMKGVSGCTIKVMDADPQVPDTRNVTITGSSAGVQIAAYLVQQKCDEAAAGVAANFGPGSSTEQLSIPTSAGPNVIGARGANIEIIKAQSGCSISVKNPSPESPDTRLVVLRGTPEAIAAAKAAIAQYL